jgi:hypothetical protein
VRVAVLPLQPVNASVTASTTIRRTADITPPPEPNPD